MRKFYIYPNGILERELQCWTNFRLSLDKGEWPGEVLKEKYNAVLVNNTSDYKPYILFNTEKDAAFFILRWA